jgi:hypothetical protein
MQELHTFSSAEGFLSTLFPVQAGVHKLLEEAFGLRKGQP